MEDIVKSLTNTEANDILCPVTMAMGVLVLIFTELVLTLDSGKTCWKQRLVHTLSGGVFFSNTPLVGIDL